MRSLSCELNKSPYRPPQFKTRKVQQRFRVWRFSGFPKTVFFQL